MLGEAIWSLKCQYRSAEVFKKGNFSSFLDFSQKTNERICSNFTQMFVFPCPIHWRDRFGRTILTRVGPKKNAQCDRLKKCPEHLQTPIIYDFVKQFINFLPLPGRGGVSSTFSYNRVFDIINGILSGLYDFFEFLDTQLSDVRESTH